jgi:hypothetical protein
MKRANSTDPKVYLPQVSKTDYKGVTTGIRFEPNGEVRDPAVAPFFVQRRQASGAGLNRFADSGHEASR